MTVLSLPRIILNGTTSWNPATNNNGLVNGYNKDPVTIKLPEGVTYDTFDDWLIAYDNGATNGSWNVYGQMQSEFVANIVGTKTDTANATIKVDDTVIGGALTFQGGTPKLVDVNPYSSVSSQVFFGGFGIDAGGGVGFSGPGTSRMTSRRPFMQRNTAGLAIAGNMGVVWQTTIARDALQWGENFAGSSALKELHDAMDRDGVLGVMLRLASYTTIYFTEIVDGGVSTPGNGTPEMNAAFKKLAERWASLQPVKVGNVARAFNPAKSSLVGVIGLWEQGELATVPTERVLAIGTGPLGPAQAKIDQKRGVVALDLQNTFPEQGAKSEKANVGSFELAARADDGALIRIATLTPFDYAKPAYDAGGGLLDVPYDGTDWDALKSGRLQLLAVNGPGKMGGMSAEPAISQLRLYADTDDRSVYLDEAGDVAVEIRVYENGARPSTATKVLLSAYYPPQQGPAEGIWQLIPTNTGPSTERSIELSGGVSRPDGIVVDVDAAGTAGFTIRASAPGNAFVTFLPFNADKDVPEAPATLSISKISTTGYCAVRVLPFDDVLGKTPQNQITWDFVYEKVLRPFDLVYRGMSAGVFSLGDENSIRAHAASIEGFTSPEEFASPLYMPVTRDLSCGRRTLLLRFLDPNSVPTA